MRIPVIGVMALILFSSSVEAAGQTPEERAALRDVAVKRGNAVVRVLATRKIRQTINGREQSRDQAVQTHATTLDGTGLVVTALSEFESPDAVTDALRASAPAGISISLSTEVVDLRMRLADGREVPAKTVLRDADLDLMFIRPADALPAPVPIVDAPSGKPSVLDPLVVIQRTGEMSGSKVMPVLSYVQVLVDKPRAFFIASVVGLSAGGAGTPAFDASGRFVGVIVRIAGTRANPLPGILPADDVREIAKQAMGK